MPTPSLYLSYAQLINILNHSSVNPPPSPPPCSKSDFAAPSCIFPGLFLPSLSPSSRAISILDASTLNSKAELHSSLVGFFHQAISEALKNGGNAPGRSRD
ncbi:hypothetical protein AMTR_s00071p00126600 [Amborella trichopoda]|uniref:Uncharacterized protein n=1 Tax=Amborella trichopoda TaxID=13333 RepID=U5DHI9_AMBTC|nr:hypothetical protein AMTR_s00071p00126600 [Amborella trichopoda]